MTAAPDDARGWSPFKWVAVIAIIFGLQAALLLWLGGRKPAPAPPARPALEVRMLSDQTGDLPGVNDPMLLVTPSPHNFSAAWMSVPEIKHEPSEWNGQASLLDQPVKPPGGEIPGLATNSLAGSFSVVDAPKPELENTPFPVEDDLADSAFVIRGDLAGRALLPAPSLQPQYWDVPLSNSVVEINVDEDGNVFDPPVILPGGSSGSADTDAYARAFAKSLQFEPRVSAGRAVPHALPRLTWGTVVFRWRTLAPTEANVPAPAP